MNGPRPLVDLRLVNGSTGDPALFIDYPGRDDAILFDAGENGSLDYKALGDLEAVFLSHFHVDHFIGFDRIVRANLDRDKALSVFGPEGTIRKVYDRIKTYEYPFFPFQKIVLKVHELTPGKMRSALLECTRRFPRPEIHEADWPGPVAYDTEDLRVEAAFAEHTTPCLSYALVEKPILFPDSARIAQAGVNGTMKPGPWIAEALHRLRAGEPDDATLLFHGQAHALGDLRKRYFVDSDGTRIAFVTDTLWGGAAKPALLRLAQGARRLYCDSFYLQEQIDSARKHRHMTAKQAAEFALEAGVEELVLIHFAARYQGRYQALLDEARAIFPNVSAEFPVDPPKNRPPRAKRS